MIPQALAAKDNEELESEYDYEKSKYIKWYDRVLLNRSAKVVTVLILTAVVSPLLLYRFLFFTSRDLPPSDGFSIGSCHFSRNLRIPCGVGHMTEAECHRQCCFDPGNSFCFHRIPSRFTYIIDREWSEETILQPRVSTVPYAFQRSLTELRLSIDEHSPTHLTLTIYDSRETNLTGRRIENTNYVYEVVSPEVNLVINSTQGTIFDTARGPLIASNNIWEITFKLTNETLYGLGELPLKPGTTKVLYNHNAGLNSIPLIFAKFNNSYHGVLIDCISPTEISVLNNNNIAVRSLTTSGLKLHVFVGPQPKDIMKDAMTVMGTQMKLEYWMLGAHICSEISDTLKESFELLQNFTTSANTEKLPYESHCGTGPIVYNADRCDLIKTNYIQRGIDLVKASRKRFVPHVSPHFIFNKNLSVSEEAENDTRSQDDCYNIVYNNEELFYRHPDSYKLYKGIVGEDNVLYPSYKNVSVDFMRKLWLYNGSLDAVILENSWPLDQSNKTHNATVQQLPYFSQNISEAFDETPPWNLQLVNNSQLYFQRHNTYGNNFANAFEKLLNTTIPTWSSSPWMNMSLVTNRQNILTSWTNLHREMIQAALGGISGNWLWSSPTCGDTDNFDPQNQANLCVKWYMANAFLPLLKIHSRYTPRDPLAFVGTHRYLMIEALKRRLSLLPYIYTTLQKGPLLRPMFFQFPSVENLTDISTQFSVGDDLIIVPNLEPLQRFVHFWLPPGTWYELWSGLKLKGEVGQAVTMSTTEADFLTVIRGGSIIVVQKDTRETAEDTRLRSKMSLTIALECDLPETMCQAAGQVFVEADTYINFAATDSKLVITIDGNTNPICNPFASIITNIINEINVFGLSDDFNNYDHHKNIETTIDLCNLNSNNEFPLR